MITVASVGVTSSFRRPNVLFRTVFAVRVACNRQHNGRFFHVDGATFLRNDNGFFAIIGGILRANRVVRRRRAINIFGKLPKRRFIILRVRRHFSSVFTIRRGSINFTQLIGQFIFRHGHPSDFFV